MTIGVCMDRRQTTRIPRAAAVVAAAATDVPTTANDIMAQRPEIIAGQATAEAQTRQGTNADTAAEG